MSKSNPSQSASFFRKRSFRSIRRRRGISILVCLGVLVEFIHLLHLHVEYRDSFRTKYQATDFTSIGLDFSAMNNPTLDDLVPDQPLRPFYTDQYVFQRQLAQGWEGITQVYRDQESGNLVVMKRFRTHKAALRNCVPLSIRSRFNGELFWPSEIPATLVFGGLQSAIPEKGTAMTTASIGLDFVPVHDYFLAQEAGSKRREWHFITPFIENGTLHNYAQRIRESNRLQTYRELDNEYRPVFHRLLATLDTLHKQRLCHDDIKPDNILVPEGHVWLLADLGTIRDVNHVHHSGRMWLETRRWHDCRFNDVYRTLISYLTFLREACSNPEEFDIQFHAGREPWSRLYWSFYLNTDDPRGALSFAGFSERREAPEHRPHAVTLLAQPRPSRFSVSSLLFGYRKVLEREVSTVLESRIYDKFGWIISLNWLVSAGPWKTACAAHSPADVDGKLGLL